MCSKATHKQILLAIKENDKDTLVQMFSSDPSLLNLSTPLGTWLHLATEYSKVEIVKLLLELGIDINVTGGPTGGSPINIAASEGNIELVQYFLDHGASMDCSEPERNPMFAAIHYGHAAIVKLLLKAGLDPLIKYTGETMKDMDAIAFAKEWGRSDIVAAIEEHIKNSS